MSDSLKPDEAGMDAAEDRRALLRSLIEQEKKSPSKSDCAQFEDTWLSLALENGLDDDLFGLLCDGFKFCGARPLAAYYQSEGNRCALPYSTISARSPMRENKNEIALRMCISLLACELKAPNSPDQVVRLFKKAVELSIKKDGKVTKNLPQYVRRLLIGELSGNLIGIDGDLVKPEADALRRFYEFYSLPLKEVAADSSQRASNRDAASELVRWLEGACGLQDSMRAGQEPISQQSNAVPSETVPQSAEDHGLPIDNRGNVSVLSVEDVLAFIRGRERKLDDAKSRYNSVMAENARLREARSGLEESLASTRQALEKVQQSNAVLRNKVEELENSASALKDQLSESKQMLTILKSDAAKREGEASKRLSRQLATDYEDFMDAQDLEMTIDLGENMRLQLESVFSILKSSGIEF